MNSRSNIPVPPCRDLREWLRYLEAMDKLAVARPELSLRHEIAAVAKVLEQERTVLFPAPDNHSIPVVANILTGRAHAAEAMKVPENDLLGRFQEAVRNPIAPIEVNKAPVQEIVHRQVDIGNQLPVPTHNELDSGPYITAGLLIARNPKSGVQNVSIHRCQLAGPDKITALLLPRNTLAYMDMAEESGQALEIAIVIGVDPCTFLASQAIMPLDWDEMGIAGALHGSPVEVVKCLSNDVRVPARAEIVLEGRILPDVREPDGPFGEFPQYYGSSDEAHVIQIDAITHRPDPLYHTITGGALEHLIMGGIPREATLLEHLQNSFPNVLDVHLSPGGVCRYHFIIKIDKQSDGQPKNIIMAAFGGHYDIKQVVIVDRDVDIFDPDEVQWAVSTRFQASKDLIVVTDAQGSKLDPSADNGITAKMGLDATAPLTGDQGEYTKIRVPGEDDVDLGEVLDDNPSAVLAQLIS
ncbi:MAG: UbiD family decarboxylase [Rhodospirillales bacterium]|jgi:2,5-furandicarboxylate decarboxylase 1|nr:3-octaprenyl-4-hydroxybenzoate carboxy-lyase [Rhodospirillaceae bacterium]MDP6429014.1 UbiD family decarboxylase [Rhodospirillales bacterium]|tara:strand:- start:2594 stop:3997 length:1404 start_codon:yes stop_codon:yes gene_type:complete